MARGKVKPQDEQVMADAWEWASEASSGHGAGVRVVLIPSGRRGVWVVRAEAVDVVDGRARSVRIQVRWEWPHAEYQTLAGAIMNALMQLDHQMGIDALDQRGAA